MADETRHRHRRAELEEALRAAMARAGVTGRPLDSVMASGCRLDGIGAGAVPDALAEADRRVRQRVEALAAALDRMDAGRYGRCEACGAPIDEARLDVVPTTTRCRGCAG